MSRMLVALAALAMMLAGCSRTNERNRIVVQVQDVAEGGVHVAAMLNIGGDQAACTADDFVPLGHVPITVFARPYTPINNATQFEPYGSFNITEISVIWEQAITESGLNNGIYLNELQAYNFISPYSVSVPVGETITFEALVVPFQLKTTGYFVNLLPCGGGDGSVDAFSATAHLVIGGHDSGSEEMVYMDAYVLVEFIPFES